MSIFGDGDSISVRHNNDEVKDPIIRVSGSGSIRFVSSTNYTKARDTESPQRSSD